MRSMVQLILGTYMVWDARRLRLCDTYFDAQQPIAEAAREATPAGACPYFAGTENRPSVHQYLGALESLLHCSFDHVLGVLYSASGNASPSGQPFERLTGQEPKPGTDRGGFLSLDLFL